MDIVTREAQILRVQTQNPYPELNDAVQEKLNTEVLGVTQSVLEAALDEELREHLSQLTGERPVALGTSNEYSIANTDALRDYLCQNCVIATDKESGKSYNAINVGLGVY